MTQEEQLESKLYMIEGRLDRMTKFLKTIAIECSSLNDQTPGIRCKVCKEIKIDNYCSSHRADCPLLKVKK